MSHWERILSAFYPRRGGYRTESPLSDQLTLQDQILKEKVLSHLRFEEKMRMKGVPEIIRGIEEERLVVVSIIHERPVSPLISSVNGNFVAGIMVDVALYRNLSESVQRMEVGIAAEKLSEIVKKNRDFREKIGNGFSRQGSENVTSLTLVDPSILLRVNGEFVEPLTSGVFCYKLPVL